MPEKIGIDPVRLEVFKHLFSSIADEMGVVLRKSSLSPNIKERRDFSCAVFDARARMIAQAAHIPVHLGSMPLSVEAAVRAFPPESVARLAPGDTVILNDPYRGGTHLPDITLVSPVFVNGQLAGYVASRAHHADIGGMAPGSMPIATELYQEGLIIPPIKLLQNDQLVPGVLDLILANVRTPHERMGDLSAQIAANQRGSKRLEELYTRYGSDQVVRYSEQLIAYTAQMTRAMLAAISDGTYRFNDVLDNDGITSQSVKICVEISIAGEQARVDFSGSSPQVAGSLNAVYAITLSAVYYVFRCLLGQDIPNNAGCIEPVTVIAPPGSVVNANSPAPVAGGNVETSQRIVDVLLGALAQACPDRIPAASQGTMNNLTIGGSDPNTSLPFTYYETIGGGMGARPASPGPSAVHSHMTNTLNTPVEALEYAYPLQVVCYEIRHGSGGKGRFSGGDGIRRDIKCLASAHISLITERRTNRPYGLAGGEPGHTGSNNLVRNGKTVPLPGKGAFDIIAGDIISIQTPGGGGFGNPGEGQA